MNKTCAIALMIVAVAFSAEGQLMASLDGPPARLERSAVPANATSNVVLDVTRFGRYSIVARSSSGVSLQLIDRMKGPGRIAGIAGEEDGRLDVFLDRGEYLIRVRGHHDASAEEAILEIHDFTELSASPAPQLVDLKLITAQLGDFEQRSYWLELEEQRWVSIEAAGRDLSDLRLWRDGSWLVDAEPATEIIDPVVGQPLRACRIAVMLPPGLYLLSAYGGAPVPWAEETGQHPLYLRSGLPERSAVGRQRFEVSPFGVDRFLVPARANLYRLELEEAVPAGIEVVPYDESRPFADVSLSRGRRGRITKESRIPAVEVENDVRSSGLDLVIVRATAGVPYVLQHFEYRREYRFNGFGDYWISTVHTGFAGDSAPATAFLARWTRGGGLQKTPYREQLVTLDLIQGWATRCNLDEALTVFLDVQQAAKYVIRSSGTRARFRIEPFFVYRPSDYRAPPFRDAGEVWDLDRGYYVLTVEPVERGILEMAIKPESLLDNLLDLIGQGSLTGRFMSAPAVRFESVFLENTDSYALYVNRQPGVKVGLVLRQLPVDIRESLPVSLESGTEVEIPIRLNEESVIRAIGDDGSMGQVSLDGGPWREEITAPKGERQLRVRNQGAQIVSYALEATPTRLEAATPLPPLPQSSLDRLPELAEVHRDRPHFFDLGPKSSATLLVTATDDALYRLESTGLLDTYGILRSRTETSLARSEQGGTGRNFFLHQYLLSGDYQLTVGTRRRSAGRLGVRLEQTTAIDGGDLRDGLPARISLEGGEAVRYGFSINEPGRYRIQSMALGRTLNCRLEDSEGWPIVAPNGPADLELDFAAGRYQLVILPQPLAGRRVTLLERIAEPLRFEGHGPHHVPLATTIHHTWLESEEGSDRVPDTWDFDLAADSPVTITIGPRMHGRILDPGEAQEVIVDGFHQSWSGELAAGHYRLETVSARVDNRVEYAIRVEPEVLIPGHRKTVQAPARVAVGIPEAAMVEISSFGEQDVRATLRDLEGRKILAADDRPGDWNFNLPLHIEGGAYILEVEAVGAENARTAIEMIQRQERLVAGVALPLDDTVSVEDQVHVQPLLGLDGELLLVESQAEETVGLALERRRADGSWSTMVTRIGKHNIVIAPVVRETEYRYRLWSVDRRGNPLRIRARNFDPPVVTEGQLASVARLSPLSSIDTGFAVIAIETRGPGLLRTTSDTSRILWSSNPDDALSECHDGLLQVDGNRAWMAVEITGERGAVKALREGLADGESIQATVRAERPLRVDFEDTAKTPRLAFASSMVGQPFIQMIGDSAAAQISATALAEGTAVALSYGNRARALETRFATPGESADVRIWTRGFADIEEDRHDLERGQIDRALRPGEAVEIDCPGKDGILRLSLSRWMVAALIRNRQPEQIFLSAKQPQVVSAETSADRLVVFNVGGDEERFAAELLPAMNGHWAITPDSPFGERFLTAGTVRIPVDPGGRGMRNLFIHGASGEPRFLAADGRLQQGSVLGVDQPGFVDIPHRRGLLYAWFGSTDQPALSLWDGSGLEPARSTRLPIRLEPDAKGGLWRVSSPGDAVLRIATPDDALVYFRDDDRQLAWIHGGGVRHLMLFGEGVVGVHGLAGESLSGWLELTAIPITEASEGLGDPVMIGPGGARAFRFVVPEGGAVGVGLRADPDTISATLISSDGALIGEGIVQMNTLEAGSYFLLAETPPDSLPVRVQPAVVGLDRPPSGPPLEIIRAYTQQGGLQ